MSTFIDIEKSYMVDVENTWDFIRYKYEQISLLLYIVSICNHIVSYIKINAVYIVF